MPKIPQEHDEQTDRRRPAIVYAAKSTYDPRGSIDAQLKDGRALAEREGFAVVDAFDDEARSAYSGNRGDGLAQAKALAEKLAAEGREPVLIVQHADRLARGDGVTADHLVEIALWARRAGVKVTSVQDPATFEGGLAFAAMMGDRNHEDSRRKARSVADGLRRTAERGEWPGGILADGYRLIFEHDEDGRTAGRRVEKDPARAWIFDLIFSLALEGWGTHPIMLELDRRGALTSPRKRTHAPRPFDANRINQTIATPFYAGLSAYKGEVVGVGQWPAYVSPEDFERLRAERRARGHVDRRRPGRPPEGAALARVAACSCGAMMVAERGHIRKDGTRRTTYVCQRHDNRPQDCAVGPIEAAPVDLAFVERLESFLGDASGAYEQLVASREAERARMAGEVARATAAVARLDRAMSGASERYAAALAAGDDGTADAIEQMVRGLKAEHGRAVALLAATQRAAEDVAGDPSVDPMLDFYNGLHAELRGRVRGARGDLKRLNAVAQDYFERVTLTPCAEGVLMEPLLHVAVPRRLGFELVPWDGAASDDEGVRIVSDERPVEEYDPERHGPMPAVPPIEGALAWTQRVVYFDGSPDVEAHFSRSAPAVWVDDDDAGRASRRPPIRPVLAPRSDPATPTPENAPSLR